MAGNNIDRLLHVYSEANAADPDTLSFWSEEIRKFCMKNGTVAFSVETLVKSYTVNDIYPSSCETAVRLLAERKQGIDRKADVLVGELDVVQGLLSALSLLSRNQSSNNKELFVCTALLDTVADRLIRHVSVLDERDSVVFVDRERGCPLEFTFAGLVHRPGLHESTKVSTLDEVDVLMSRLTDDEVNVLLKYMVKQQRAVLSEDGKVVKVLRNRPAQPKSASLITTIWGGISSVISSPGAAAPRVLNEADVAALYLKHSIRQVEDRIEALRVNSADLLRKAKVAKSAGEDKQALVYLGMRRSRDQARNRLLQSLVGLVEAQEAIGQCELNITLTNAYTTAARSLKSTREQAGLTADSAAEAMEYFQEEMEEMSAIGDIISSGHAMTDSPEDEALLEAELAALMAEKETERQTSTHVAMENLLPSAPQAPVRQGEHSAVAVEVPTEDSAAAGPTLSQL